MVQRVLQVLGGMNQGGVENFLMNLYRNIDKNKIQFDFLVNRQGIFDEEIKTMGGKIYYIPALQEIGQAKYEKILDKFFVEHKEYKIVHSHLNQVTGLILERAKRANIPIRISHSHSSKSPKNIIIRNYKNYLGKKIRNNANFYFACSKLSADWLYKGYSENATIIKNAIDVKKFIYNEEVRKETRKSLNINKDTLLIGHIGRFDKAKNHLFLLKIFKEIIKKNENSMLILIGDGKLKNKIIQTIEAYGIEKKVKLLGIRKDVNKILQALDLMVFPSIYERVTCNPNRSSSSGTTNIRF